MSSARASLAIAMHEPRGFYRPTAVYGELRLNSFIKVDGDAGGMMRLTKPLQGFATAMFVQVPEKLEPFIIPALGKEILVTVNYDWIDLSQGRAILADSVSAD
jgi:hypothetical protein